MGDTAAPEAVTLNSTSALTNSTNATTPTTSSTTTTTTIAVPGTPARSPDGDDNEMYLIMGVVLGCVVFLIVVIIIAFVVRNHRRAKRNIQQLHRNTRGRPPGINSLNGINNNTYDNSIAISDGPRNSSVAGSEGDHESPRLPKAFIIPEKTQRTDPTVVSASYSRKTSQVNLTADEMYDRPKSPTYFARNYETSFRVARSPNPSNSSPIGKYDKPRSQDKVDGAKPEVPIDDDDDEDYLVPSELPGFSVPDGYDKPRSDLYKVPKSFDDKPKTVGQNSPSARPKTRLPSIDTTAKSTKVNYKKKTSKEEKQDLSSELEDLPSYENCEQYKLTESSNKLTVPTNSISDSKGRSKSNGNIDDLEDYENCNDMKRSTIGPASAVRKSLNARHKLKKQANVSTEGSSHSYQNSSEVEELKALSPIMAQNRRQKDKSRSKTHIGIAGADIQEAQRANPRMDKSQNSRTFDSAKAGSQGKGHKLNYAHSLASRQDLQHTNDGDIYSNVTNVKELAKNFAVFTNKEGQANTHFKKHGAKSLDKSGKVTNSGNVQHKASVKSAYEEPDTVNSLHVKQEEDLTEDSVYTPMDGLVGAIEEDEYIPMASIDDKKRLQDLESHALARQAERKMSTRDSPASSSPSSPALKPPTPHKSTVGPGYVNYDNEPQYQNFFDQ